MVCTRLRAAFVLIHGLGRVRSVSRRVKIAIVMAVIIFWGAMTFTLLRREVFLPKVEVQGERSRLFFDPGSLPLDSWLGIYFNENKIGYSHSIITESPASTSAYVAQNRTVLRFSLLGEPTEFVLDAMAELDEQGRTVALDFRLVSEGTRTQVSGRFVGDGLELQVETGGSTFEKTLPVSPDIVLSNTVSPLLVVPSLEEGVEYKLDIVDPITLSSSEARITVLGRERNDVAGKRQELSKVSVQYQGFTTTAWVTDDGEVVRVETPLGVTMIKETEDEALDRAVKGTELSGDHD